jgi:DNA-binding transcriptional ArsR family regulator
MVKYEPKSLDTIFSALSDPTRRAMLERLAQGEVTVSELASAAPNKMSLPAISKHVRILEDAGLIVRRKDGREHHLKLSGAAMRDAAGWINRYRHFWDYQFDSLAQYLAEEDAAAERTPGEQSDQ